MEYGYRATKFWGLVKFRALGRGPCGCRAVLHVKVLGIALRWVRDCTEILRIRVKSEQDRL